jgi:hypothetical protein
MVMEKSKFEKFIGKYNLGGSCESVTFRSDGNTLTVRSISDDKNVLGEVQFQQANFPAGEFGVYETKKLRSILSVMEDRLTVTAITTNDKITGLNLTDGETKATFVLADITVIPTVPELKKLPPVDFTITLDEKFVTTFIKAKSALADVDTFAVMSDGHSTTANIVIGYSSLNTNRISINATADVAAEMSPINFSATYFREILVANKDAKNGKLEISSKGLARATFDVDNISTTYYLVQEK